MKIWKQRNRCNNNSKIENKKQKDKPARILRPGAETKVGGSPLTTIGFKAPALLILLWLLSTTKEEEEEGVSLGGWEEEEEGGGSGNELRQSDANAMGWEEYHLLCYVPITLLLSNETKKNETHTQSHSFIIYLFIYLCNNNKNHTKAPQPSIWYPCLFPR